MEAACPPRVCAGSRAAPDTDLRDPMVLGTPQPPEMQNKVIILQSTTHARVPDPQICPLTRSDAARSRAPPPGTEGARRTRNLEISMVIKATAASPSNWR